MKKLLKLIGIFAGLAVLTVLVVIALTPWRDRWGATAEEIAATYPGDELLPELAGKFCASASPPCPWVTRQTLTEPTLST